MNETDDPPEVSWLYCCLLVIQFLPWVYLGSFVILQNNPGLIPFDWIGGALGWIFAPITHILRLPSL